MKSMALEAFGARSNDFTPYITCRNWIGGRWAESASGQKQPVMNPRHGRPMGEVVLSDARDVGLAVAAAKAAFPAWKNVPMKERAQVLYRLKQLMERDLEELAWLVSHENGKTFDEAKGSVLKGIECVEFGTSLPNLVAAGQIDVSRGVNCQATDEPLGVVAGIAPFNFPIMVPLWMMPQALVAGNTFVLKPSEQVPYGALKLAGLLEEAGLPAGVFNVVNGAKATVEAVVDHPDIKAVGFVGSTKVARLLFERGTRTGKRMLCLGGAKNHLVVVPDADIAMTSQNVVASAFGCAGQRCMAASVLIAVGDVQKVVDGVVEITQKIRLGVDLGPVISQAAVERINGAITQAESMGAKVLVDGRHVKPPGGAGFWVGATVLDRVTPQMPAGCEELFGPVLSIQRVATVDEALAVENASPYGNAACIYTTNGGVARYCIERFEAGMCGVNIGVPVPREPFAFGGWNDSKFGNGDITGMDGWRFWTRTRKVTTKWSLQSDTNWMS